MQATFTKRKGQVVSSILEIKYVVEDCRSTVVRGIVAGIDIWKLAVLPNLLNNSETWTELHKKTVESLEDIQYMFYRYLLATPRSCPKPALLWETGGMLMEHRVAQKKLVFYHHLLHLPKNSLAYEIADTQASLAYPDLVQCYELIEKYKLPDAKDQTKIQWKILVKNKSQKEYENDLLENVIMFKND